MRTRFDSLVGIPWCGRVRSQEVEGRFREHANHHDLKDRQVPLRLNLSPDPAECVLQRSRLGPHAGLRFQVDLCRDAVVSVFQEAANVLACPPRIDDLLDPEVLGGAKYVAVEAQLGLDFRAPLVGIGRVLDFSPLGSVDAALAGPRAPLAGGPAHAVVCATLIWGCLTGHAVVLARDDGEDGYRGH